MSSPVKPADVRAVIPDPNSSLCGNFKNALLRLPVLFYQFINWLLDLDGNLSVEFKKLLSNALLPTGTIITSGSSSTPEGYLLCNGQAVSRTTYADLFAAIGENFGAGDGATTFALPDLRDKFVLGAGNKPIGETGGEDEHTLTAGEIAHIHVTGRWHDESGEQGNDPQLLTKVLDTAQSGAARELSIEGSSFQEPNISDATGPHIVTTDPIASDGAAELDPTPIAMLPPYVALYHYIRT